MERYQRGLEAAKGWIGMLAVVMLLSTLIGTNYAQAQLANSLTVTVEGKGSAHPESQRGFSEAFVIDGQQGKSVAVVRGETYTFQMDNVPSLHPFYLTTSAVGLGADPYDQGVSGNFASGNDAVTFTPDQNTPDLLYYQCQNHQYMGWRIYVMDRAEARLQTVAQGLGSPIQLKEADDGSGRLFIVEQTGQIRIVSSDGTLLDEPFLDVSDRMVELRDNFDERGLLGLAFHPGYQSNGRFYVYYSAPLRGTAPSDWDNTATISEFQVSSSDANRADPDSERIILQVDEPQFNHAGGTLDFGADGFLYISLGDGGGADDHGMGHVSDWYAANEGGNAQNVEENLLGKILRIDVDGGSPYGIPQSNPFVGRSGLDEIFAYGLRNPYRMSFDMGGEFGLLAGDAGQNRWEEVDQIELGANYGWNVKEGTHCFSTADPDQDAASCPDEVGSGHPDTGLPLTGPVIEYKNANQDNGVGLVVVGGRVYRGSELPEFEGKYVFGDWSYSPSEPRGLLFLATPADEGRWPVQPLRIDGRADGELREYVLGFGQDLDGEVYVLSTETPGPSGNSGNVYRLVSTQNVSSEEPEALPGTITLQQNYPNPFNPATTIHFSLPRAQHVSLVVYDLLGREVATLIDGMKPTGLHAVSFSGVTDGGEPLPSGSYLYRLETGSQVQTRIMTLVK